MSAWFSFTILVTATAVTLAAGAMLPRRWGGGLARTARRLARRRAWAVACVVGFALLASLGATNLRPAAPKQHDEFSYLLAADTFAHGRLTNPTHPLWEHFESPHIIHQPTYASKYPPVQGLILAAGQVLFGRPLVAVWLSLAAACAAVCWMLQSWLPPRWALAGGLLLAVHPGIHHCGDYSWSRTCWGGAAALAGGALLYGSLRRLTSTGPVPPGSRACYLVVLGAGLGLLANSRPFEGFVVSLPAAGVLGVWLLRRGRRQGYGSALGSVWPLALVLLVVAALMGYYHWRVTGHPLRPPYVVHEEQYGVAPLFCWQSLRPLPSYRHEALRALHGQWSPECYQHLQTLAGWFGVSRYKLAVFWGYYGNYFVLPLLMLPWIVRSPWMRLAFGNCLLMTAALLQMTWHYPHYEAPVIGLLLVLIVQGLRQWAAVRLGGRRVGWAIVGLTLVLFLHETWIVAQTGGSAEQTTWQFERAALLTHLQGREGQHLVVVRYRPDHDIEAEWVFNAADIDAAKVIWAREMDPAHNTRLLNYFRDRQVWLLDADVVPPRLTAYPP